jgi:hypothetical protein
VVDNGVGPKRSDEMLDVIAYVTSQRTLNDFSHSALPDAPVIPVSTIDLTARRHLPSWRRITHLRHQ